MITFRRKRPFKLSVMEIYIFVVVMNNEENVGEVVTFIVSFFD